MASAVIASQNEPDWGKRKVYKRKNPNSNPNPRNSISETLTPIELQEHQQLEDLESRPEGASQSRSNSSTQNETPSAIDQRREIVDSPTPGYVTFNIAAYTKKELGELKQRLLSELGNIRSLIDRIDSIQVGGGSDSTRPPSLQQQPHSYSPLVVEPPSMPTPYYHPIVTKKGTKRPAVSIFGRDPKRVLMEFPMGKMLASVSKRCGQILTKLMKHKHGWIFNDPVDVMGMQLHDYHQIIRDPMDLGTVKSRLMKNLYSSPLDFAADVRLTFRNALTYNPKGHDVYNIAEQLMKLFEQMFEPAHKKFMNEQKMDEMRRNAIAAEEMRRRQREELRRKQREREIAAYEEQQRKNIAFNRVPSPEFANRRYSTPITPAPRNPENINPISSETKSKDPVMSTEEKETLSVSLQELPQEKMPEVVHIIKKGNNNLAQDGDEIEVDFELLGNDTLWELHRLVHDYNASLKRQQLSLPVEHNQIESDKSPSSEMTEAVEPDNRNKKREDAGEEDDIDIGDDVPTNNFPPVEIEKDVVGGNNSRSSSSSSSGSDSDSSSDSDSGSSSGDEAQSPSKAAPPIT
ncbi:hypothetical protein GIB67_017951 [Kingdonia uniflora]|uniref:Uncharacterized protein n=1 Tax=Kingdonia uniflora TaxID=39325 RepID=A0A7J7MI19_9MAGN|nr:hypothetical protein GIB67_017951 [Kingdonia uniflora]